MPQPKKGYRLGGNSAHQKAILSNLSRALIEHEKIRTTQTKAKEVQPLAEKLITLAKDGDLHARRQALRVITDKAIIHKLFDEIGPRYQDRPGGYTRIIKLGPRLGDAAPMVILELV
jgi:large subunit ribosomal protein L17